MSTVSSTFIIRLWTATDPLSGEPQRGHGRIDHLQSGESIYFDQLQDALAFLRRHFGAYESLEPDVAAQPRTSGVTTPNDQQLPDHP